MLGSLFGGIQKWIVQLLAVSVAVMATAAAGATGIAYWQWNRAAALKADLGRERARVVAYQEAARIRRADDARRAEIDARATERDHALQTDPGGDEPLGPYLGRAAGRLWP